MFSLSPNTIASSATSPLVRKEVQCRRQIKHIGHGPLGFGPLSAQSPEFGQRHLQVSRMKSASFICASALNARCSGAEQTQTITRESSTITIAPTRGKEKSPDLDDGGDGFPPRDDGDGGGGGGGGGGWGGGFFFFGFLGLLSMMQDNENENN